MFLLEQTEEDWHADKRSIDNTRRPPQLRCSSECKSNLELLHLTQLGTFTQLPGRYPDRTDATFALPFTRLRKVSSSTGTSLMTQR
jgi:hypothetical protein